MASISIPFSWSRQFLFIVWLFGGLRVDEIQAAPSGVHEGKTGTWMGHRIRATASVCNLDVPVNKTSHAFYEAGGSDSWRVDPRLGKRQRPAQPAAIDEKTGELVHFLFTYRGKRPGTAVHQ